MSSFFSSRLTLVVLVAIVGLIFLDIKNHESFKASKTYRFLKDSGALHYGDIAFSNFRAYSQQGYRWCQKNVPVYFTKIRESAIPHLRTLLEWFTTLAQQLWANVKLLCGYFLEKRPFIEQWINQNSPGLLDVVGSWLRQAWTFVREYTVLLVNLLHKYLIVAGQWLMENVFIGSLSPENLQKYTWEALNTTQQLASHTFSWLSDKVITVTSAS